MGCLLTGSPTVTTPRSFTTLGCLNCPLIAASCRNLTLSSCDALDCSVFTATSTAPAGDCHIPLFTVPNWPEPRCCVILKKHKIIVTMTYYKIVVCEATHWIWCLRTSRYFLSATYWSPASESEGLYQQLADIPLSQNGAVRSDWSEFMHINNIC